MALRYRHILLAFAAGVILVAGCSRNKIISKRDFRQIYAEIFIADQTINIAKGGRHMADTSLVYAAIFEKYGYTSEDYRRSLEYYMQDPMRFTRTIKQSALLVDKKIKEVEKLLKEAEERENAKQKLSAYRPEKLFFLKGLFDTSGVFTLRDSLKIALDSTGRGGWTFDPQAGRDTIFHGPVIILKTSPEDTLAVHEAENLPELEVPASVIMPSPAAAHRPARAKSPGDSMIKIDAQDAQIR